MPGCGPEPEPLFLVRDADDRPVNRVDSCRRPCQALDTGGCTLLCAASRTILLQPDEVLSTSWAGLYGVTRELPASCAEAETEPTAACQQAKRIEPGTFTFTAVAGTSLTCDQSGSPDGCPCERSPEGGCVAVGSLIAGDALNAATTVALDEQYGVYPAPAADPSSGAGAAPGIGARLSVELVFE